jgi:hypothetical protein
MGFEQNRNQVFIYTEGSKGEQQSGSDSEAWWYREILALLHEQYTSKNACILVPQADNSV